MKLRTFLLAVVGLTLVPLLGVAGLAIWWAHEDERRNMEQALLYHARSLTVAVDREVETSLAGLKGLATYRPNTVLGAGLTPDSPPREAAR